MSNTEAPPTVNVVWTIVEPLDIEPGATQADVEAAIQTTHLRLRAPITISPRAAAFAYAETIHDHATDTHDIGYVLVGYAYSRDANESLQRRLANHDVGTTEFVDGGFEAAP